MVYDVPASLVQGTAQVDWRQLEYHVTSLTDNISSRFSLSAAWPALGYTKYSYSVSTTQGFQPCGSTVANSLTVAGLLLQHGQRNGSSYVKKADKGSVIIVGDYVAKGREHLSDATCSK